MRKLESCGGALSDVLSSVWTVCGDVRGVLLGGVELERWEAMYVYTSGVVVPASQKGNAYPEVGAEAP